MIFPLLFSALTQDSRAIILSPFLNMLSREDQKLIDIEKSISLDFNFSTHQDHLERLLKHRLLGHSPRVSYLVCLVWSLRIYISYKFFSDDSRETL